MTELEKLERAKMYIDKLASGFDPITDSEFPNDTVLNNERLSRCFSYVSEILKKVIDNGGRVNPPGNFNKSDFSISPQQLSSVKVSAEPQLISHLLNKVNELIDTGVMKKLTALQATNWLLDKGFLEEVEHLNKKRKLPTAQGLKLGINTEIRTGQYGEYKAVVYNETAQRFILDNIESIAQYSRRRSEDIN